MNSLKNLSFDNIEVTRTCDSVFGERTSVKVLDDNGDCLSEAVYKTFKLKDFSSDYFYPELLKKELETCFLELKEEEQSKVQYMPLDDFVKYINKRYHEDEISTLNWLYKTYNTLNEYNHSNVLNGDSDCVFLYSINSNYDNTGAGKLIVDYLKTNYELIFLYSTIELEGYWLDKVNFAEILNGYLYWTENAKLSEIL